MWCWLLGHKPLQLKVEFARFRLGVGFRSFMDGARVRLCDRCHAVYWEPYVDHEARQTAWEEHG